MDKANSWLKIFFILCRLHVCRLKHATICLWHHPSREVSGLSKALAMKQAWGFSVRLVLLALTLLGTHIVTASYIQRQLDPTQVRSALLDDQVLASSDLLRFTRYEDVPDQGARFMTVFLASTLLSAFLLRLGRWKGATDETEWAWFDQQAIAPLPLFIQRCVVESVTPHWMALFIWPFFTMLAGLRGWSWGLAPLFGFCVLLLLQASITAPRLCLELWLRQKLRPLSLRRVRAILGVFGAILLTMSLQSMSHESDWSRQLVLNFGSFLDRTPFAFALSLGLLRERWAGFQAAVWLLLSVTFIHGLCFLWAAKILHKGIESKEHYEGHFAKPNSRLVNLVSPLWLKLHPWVRRDLLLLSRDQHFVLQMLVTPWLLSLLPFSGWSAVPGAWEQDPSLFIPLAFMAGIFFLLGAVPQILHSEGPGIWLLFTFPYPLHRLIQLRLLLWFGLAAVYASCVLGMASLHSKGSLPLLTGKILGLYWGLGLFTLIMAGAAVFAYKLQLRRREYRPPLLGSLGILLLSGIYAWLLLQQNPWIMTLMIFILTGWVMLARRKLIASLPYLLDPSAGPR